VKFGQWLGLIVLLLSLYILWEIRQVLLLVFLAIVFATALNRIVRRLRQSGAGRGIGTLLSVISLLAILGLFIALIVPPFAAQFRELAALVPLGLERLRAWLVILQERIPGSALENLPSIDSLIQQAQPFARWTFNNFFFVFSNVISTALSLLLVLVLMVMFLINPLPYRQGFIRLFPAFYRQRIDEILSLCEVALVAWIRGILIDMVVIGVVSAIGLSILRIPAVLANSALAGLLEAVPNIGPTLSLIPPMAIALLDAPWKALAVFMFYIVLQQLEQFLLVPYVMATQVELLPAVTLLSQVVFAIFFGFLGLLLAIPLVIVGQIWIQEVVIKDHFDRWQTHPTHQLNEAIAPNTESAIIHE
jgi:predicted PurR-regulated permease PerM